MNHLSPAVVVVGKIIIKGKYVFSIIAFVSTLWRIIANEK